MSTVADIKAAIGVAQTDAVTVAVAVLVALFALYAIRKIGWAAKDIDSDQTEAVGVESSKSVDTENDLSPSNHDGELGELHHVDLQSSLDGERHARAEIYDDGVRVTLYVDDLEKSMVFADADEAQKRVSDWVGADKSDDPGHDGFETVVYEDEPGYVQNLYGENAVDYLETADGSGYALIKKEDGEFVVELAFDGEVLSTDRFDDLDGARLHAEAFTHDSRLRL